MIPKIYNRFLMKTFFLFFPAMLTLWVQPFYAKGAAENKGPPPVPVKTAVVEKKSVAAQISLIGNVEPVLKSTVASEVSGIVEHFPVKEGDFVKKGHLLARIKSRDLSLRIKAAKALREKIQVSLENAGKELKRVSRLKKTDSISERRYDEANANYRMLYHDLSRSEAEIERLKYEIKQKKVIAPLSGFIVEEHTMIGQWLKTGGAVVTILDLSRILITVDVPERYYVQLSPNSAAAVTIKNVSKAPFTGKIVAMLAQGDPASRTFPVKVGLDNTNYRIKSGMEAVVTFSLPRLEEVLLVPKDALVPAGDRWRLFRVTAGKAFPINVKVLGYYDGNAAVDGVINAGDQVVIRGNERLRPGQPVEIQ